MKRRLPYVQPIGRLHFLVGSRSRPNPDAGRIFGPEENFFGLDATEYLVDLLPIECGGFTIPYFCSCERHTKNHYYVGEICHHLEAAVAYVQANYYPDPKMNLTTTHYRLFGRKLATGHDHLRPSLRPNLPFAMTPTTKEECEECALLIADQGFETCIVPDGEEPVFASDTEWDEQHPAEPQAPAPVEGTPTGNN